MPFQLRNLLASFTRPANTTQYAAGDLVANHATAGNVVALSFVNAAPFPGGELIITGVQIMKSGVAVANAAFRVHLFAAAPTVTNGDNGALAITNGRAKGYIGRVDVTVAQALGDGAHGRAAAAIQFDAAKGFKNLYALVEALDTYTPASAEIFDIVLEVQRARS